MEVEETNEPQSPAEPQGLILLQEAQYALHQAGKWANFLAIMGFIGSGFMALGGLFFGAVMSAASSIAGAASRLPTGFFGIIPAFYIALAIVYFLISRHLYRFAGSIKSGVEFQSADEISKAFQRLHSFFKWNGIIVIVIISLYVLVVIGFIVAAAVGMSAFNSGYQV